MAKQAGEIKIKGTIGNLTFYKMGGQYLVRQKADLTQERIKSDPKYARVRDHRKVFKGVINAVILLRNSFKNLAQNASDKSMYQRLLAKMFKVVQSDTTSIRGERNVCNGRLELLQGFEFNIHHKLSIGLHALHQCDINRDTGLVTVSILPFIPANVITAPNNTTYFTITAGVAAVDFQAGEFVADTKKTSHLPFNSLPTDENKIELIIKATGTLPIFIVLGIEFYEEIDGVQQMVGKGDYNSLALVAISVN
jgi:hypothetical protein